MAASPLALEQLVSKPNLAGNLNDEEALQVLGLLRLQGDLRLYVRLHCR